jgi:hypothetical protein
MAIWRSALEGDVKGLHPWDAIIIIIIIIV